MESLGELWRALPANDLLRTGILLACLVAVRVLAVRALARQPQISIEMRRRWSVNLRNALLIAGLIGIVAIWSRELQTVAVSLVVIASAIAIAFKEVILCLSGSFYRTMSKAYNIGDRIELGELRGRVVDISVLTTTIVEIGPQHDAHQQTGRLITFPNSLLLGHALAREDYTGNFIVHVITVPVSLEADVLEAERILIDAAREVCAPFLEEAQAHMKALESMHLIDTPSVAPRVSLKIVDDEIVRLNLRIAVPRIRKQTVEQDILHRFLAAFHPARPPSADQTDPS
ncbi:mechanosensitive ion channel family protein [Laribacter hongkongensis]|uniref:mechanosensitive ion channel family protein n=1 Tax=Laribacter hongkongensis TaxID=168471 RepID=UPI001EFC59D3|nr:mechanosensitive ion channel family protein [Laribacter hongkongensis]MCG9064410.1 mechanosensitive ion channel family protein [Laribacter hongkongensis]MCG9077783.1 mechanosensitive ion channel family protein [Laribacter hongkongensis]MCG9082597.1 mechanosensitive ion channel family protein [Laribacter hongkongensis]